MVSDPPPQTEGIEPFPIIQRLELEHALDIHKLRSEQEARELKSERKTADRARRKEEKTSQQLRAECAAMVQQLQAMQAQHQVHEKQEHAHAKKMARMTAQYTEQTGTLAAQREMLHRADQRVAEQQQQILQLSVAAEQERGRTGALSTPGGTARLTHGLTEAETELERGVLAWRQHAEAVEARTAEARVQLIELDRAAARKLESGAADTRRARVVAHICSRRFQWHPAHAFQKWLSYALADDLRLATADWCALAAAHGETGAALARAYAAEGQAAALVALQASRADGELLWLRAAVRRTVFNARTVRRTVFALWRMWAQGTRLHEWARAQEARQAGLHFEETKWWLEK